MKVSIRVKFLAVMSSLLALCLTVYLFMAVTVFKSDKTALVFDLNRSQVANLTSELETQFDGVSEKLKIFAQLPSELQVKMATDLLTDNSDLVAVAIYSPDQAQARRWFHQDKFLETYGLDADFFTKITADNPVPMSEILRHGEEIWNASGPGGPPLIGYGRLVVMQDERGVPVEQWAVIGFVKLDRLLKSVSLVGLSDIFVANRHGEVLVSRTATSLLGHPKVLNDELFREAVDMKAKISVVDRKHADANDRVLAALSKGFNDQIFVVARASESAVFQVVKDLTTRTLLFGSIVLTLVILAAFLISRSLTQNIAQLADAMESVAKGDLTTSIHLRGRDETVSLGNSFNQMIHELKDSRDRLEELNRDLDAKVKERTEQLEVQNKKVKEVQEALIRTTRLASVGELAGRTAHEVLNPLTILLARAGLVQKKVGNDQSFDVINDIRQAWDKDYADGGFDRLIVNWKSKSSIFPDKNLFQEDLDNLDKIFSEMKNSQKSLAADIQFIREEGERIGKIINGMRRLGHLKSDAKPNDLHTVLNDCCQIMTDLFEQQGYRIERRFQAANSVCLVDRDEMVQSITNLMRNSLQALMERAEKDGVMRVITQSSGNDLLIDIEDNGVGISAAHQSRLFEASFTTKSPEQGTGLGLGIARRFVRGYHGDIEFISSQPGVRTVFRIRLPLNAMETTGAAA